MRDRLLSGISNLCWLFPPLKPSITYSDILSQEEVDLFVAFVNGHVAAILRNCHDKSAQEQYLSKILKSSMGLPRIRPADVLYVESLLASASGRDNLVSSEFKDIVLFLREHKSLWWSLHNAYEKIVKNNLIGTCPLVVAKPPFLAGLLGLHKFEEFHKLFHESIHCVLEDNGVCFHDEEIDEGLVVFMHQQVMGRHACSLHYAGRDGSRFLKYAERFERFCQKHPRCMLLHVLKGMSVEEIKGQ